MWKTFTWLLSYSTDDVCELKKKNRIHATYHMMAPSNLNFLNLFVVMQLILLSSIQ